MGLRFEICFWFMSCCRWGVLANFGFDFNGGVFIFVRLLRLDLQCILV